MERNRPGRTRLRSAPRLFAICLLGAVSWAAPETHMVAMRDGVRLCTDVYLPDGEGPFPVLLSRSYYGRTPGAGMAERANAKGMAYVIQDTRGRGRSEGKDMVFADDGWGERQDGVDTVRWIRAQSWCNGRIGTFGMSALGITQMRLAATGEPLTCVANWCGATDFYSQVSYGGGVFRKNLCESWSAAMGSSHIIPIWKAHPTYDAFWEAYNTDARAEKTTAPVFHVGGWWDIFAQGTIDGFVVRQHRGGEGAKGNQYLLMGPWTHAGPTGNRVGELSLASNSGFDFDGETMKFLVHFLNGPAGPLEMPTVRYYTVGDAEDPEAPGNEWRTASDWPPFETIETAYYLGANGMLGTAPPGGMDGSLSYVFDPRDPCPTHGGQNLAIPAGPYDQRELAKRPDVLSFATPPLETPIEITGRVKVRLYVSSDGMDTDFAAKLLDIYPDGRAFGMLDGIRRLKFRRGFEKAEPLLIGEVGELEIDLWSISLIFNRGHRIGLQVSSSNFPKFEVNPNTGSDFPLPGEPMRKARNTVHMSAAHPSALILPVRAEPASKS